MMLAEKIAELRKKNGWSQEELAGKLHVSRQSVSKWESGQSAPDMARLLLLSEVFDVSTDVLLKDGPFEEKHRENTESSETKPTFVSLEEAQRFLKHRKKAATQIPLGVLLCILSPILLILLSAAQETGRIALSEEQATGFGLLTLLLLVGIAVALFVLSALSGKPFVVFREEPFEMLPGVSNDVREKKEAASAALSTQLVAGIVLCVLSAVPIFIAMILFGAKEERVSDFAYAVAVALLLCFVGCGVRLILRACIQKDGYEILLEEGDYSRRSKKEQKRLQPIAAIYWCLITAGYLAYSFLTSNWEKSWIIWPVAGVVYGVIAAIVAVAIRNQEERWCCVGG